MNHIRDPQNGRLPPVWKVQREIARVKGRIGDLFSASFGTLYNDKFLARQRTVLNGSHKKLGTRAAVYVIYPTQGLLRSHLSTLEYFAARGFSCVVVSNLPLKEHERNSVLGLAHSLIERSNFGYDFGGYREGVLHLGDKVQKLKQLVLINDSTWFPLPETRDWLDDVEATGADFVGASSHLGVSRPRPDAFRTVKWERSETGTRFHYGSYALSIGAKVLKCPDFLAFWLEMRLTNNKDAVVRRGEAGLTQWIIGNGFTHAETLGTENLDVELRSLPLATLRTLARDLVLPFDEEMRLVRSRLIAGNGLGRDELVALILTATARQGASYVLAPYSIFRKGFPFLKKVPLKTNLESAEATMRIVSSLPGPEGQMIREEAEEIYAQTFARRPTVRVRPKPAASQTASKAA